MLNKQPTNTDLVNELVANFGRNQETLKVLIEKVTTESTTNLDPIAQAKLRELRQEILIEDVKGQDHKIELISKVLDEVCSTPVLPKG